MRLHSPTYYCSNGFARVPITCRCRGGSCCRWWRSFSCRWPLFRTACPATFPIILLYPIPAPTWTLHMGRGESPVLALWDAWVLFNKRFYHLLWLFVASGQRLGSSSLSRKHASMSYLSIICAFQALLPGCLFLFVCFFVSIFNRFVCPFHSCQLQLCFLSIFPTWPKVPRALPLLSWSAEGLWKGLFFGATPVGEGDSLCVYIETYSIYYRYMYTYILKNRCMYISEVRCASQGRQQKGIFAAVDDRKNYFSANTTSNILDLPE